MTVAELLDRTSARELVEWAIADKLDYDDDERRRATSK